MCRQRHNSPATGPSRVHRGGAPGGSATAQRTGKKPRFAILDAHSTEANPLASRAAAAGRRLWASSLRGDAGALAAGLQTPVQHRRPAPVLEEEDAIEDAEEEALDAAPSGRERPPAGAAWDSPSGFVTPEASATLRRDPGHGGLTSFAAANSGTPAPYGSPWRHAVLARPAPTSSMASGHPGQRRQMVRSCGLSTVTVAPIPGEV